MLLELFVLGHVSFVWLFAGYFWDLCVLLELFALGHVSCVFTCASWIWLSIPYMRVLFCVYFNLFFGVFYLRQLFYLRDVSVTCDALVSNCFYLSMSKCKLQTVGLFHG